jgi:multicomponent Na+:H+ antiporter subunit G
MTTLLAAAGLVFGALFLALAAYGVWRLPDALSRQHAATKAGTLALAFICGGAMLATPEAAFVGRLVAIVLLLLLTLPVASHLLGRAAAQQGYPSDELNNAPLVDDGGPDASSDPRAG